MKKIVSVLLVVLLIASCALAEAANPARPSMTVATVVTPAGSAVAAEGLVITLNNLKPETKEQKVLEEIAVFVEEKPVVEYFGEEAMAAVVEILPETVATEKLVLDEIFVLDVEGYDSGFGDVEAVFEFATTYEDDTVLVVMVGIMPEDGTEGEIIWVPLQASVKDGKVNVSFTQDVLEAVQGNSGRVVLSLLRADENA